MAVKIGENTFFTSDTHFCHNQDFMYKPRGYSSIEEHDEKLVERWNETIGLHDIVYHLGDFCLNDVQKAISYIQRLQGTIYWLQGNHDTDNKIKYVIENCPNVKVFDTNEYSQVCKYNKFNLYCSHYPTLTANFDDAHFNQHVINLHGHTHQMKNWIFADNPFVYHVGIDSHNNAPVNIEEILTDIRNRWNELGNLNISPTGIYHTYPQGEIDRWFR